MLGRARLHRLRKNSDSRRFSEGHDFSRAVESLKMRPRFSARGAFFALRQLFQRLFRHTALSGYNIWCLSLDRHNRREYFKHPRVFFSVLLTLGRRRPKEAGVTPSCRNFPSPLKGNHPSKVDGKLVVIFPGLALPDIPSGLITFKDRGKLASRPTQLCPHR
jgi:hypothetical protein